MILKLFWWWKKIEFFVMLKFALGFLKVEVSHPGVTSLPTKLRIGEKLWKTINLWGIIRKIASGKKSFFLLHFSCPPKISEKSNFEKNAIRCSILRWCMLPQYTPEIPPQFSQNQLAYMVSYANVIDPKYFNMTFYDSLVVLKLIFGEFDFFGFLSTPAPPDHAAK